MCLVEPRGKHMTAQPSATLRPISNVNLDIKTIHHFGTLIKYTPWYQNDVKIIYCQPSDFLQNPTPSQVYPGYKEPPSTLHHIIQGSDQIIKANR